MKGNIAQPIPWKRIAVKFSVFSLRLPGAIVILNEVKNLDMKRSHVSGNRFFALLRMTMLMKTEGGGYPALSK